MKKTVILIASLVLACTAAQAQSGLLGALTNALGTVYSAKTQLDGNYSYNGIAVSVSSSEGGVVTNLAGTAVTAGIESQIDGVLAKIGIKPGALTWAFNADNSSFVLTVCGIPVDGTYKMGDGEKTVNLSFGKGLQFFNMTGTVEFGLDGSVRLLFPANKAVEFLKKIAKVVGENSKEISSITKLADGYDSYKIGFKLAK